MKFARRSILSLIAISVVIMMALAGGIGAAPEFQADVVATEDIYVVRSSPNTVYDNGLLYLQQNLTGTFEADKVTLLKFDLSGIAFPIAKARLNLGVVSGRIGGGTGCPTSVALPEIHVYDASNTWTETSTWTSIGGFDLRGSLRADLDETAYSVPVHLHWTDDGTDVNDTLAAYLELRRNAADHTASLWIQPVGTGNGQMVFGDHEATASTLCVGADLVPTLQLADASDPLTVTMATSSAETVTWPLYAGLGAVALVVMAGLAVSRRRMA